MKFNLYLKNNTGFTIIEVFFAVLILTLGIVSASSSVRTAVYANTETKNRVTASYLADEGIEYIKNVWQNNYESGIDGLGIFTGSSPECVGEGNECAFDVKKRDVWSVEACSPLVIDPSDDLYICDDGLGGGKYIQTLFTRSFHLEQVTDHSGSIEYRAIVTVDWKGNRGSKVVYTTELYPLNYLIPAL